MNATVNTAVMPAAAGVPSRKRRRSREPNWSSFYRNGLPKEIIVIEDTPETEANTSRKMVNGQANTYASTNVPANGAAMPHPPKKRRRDDDPSAALVHHPGYHVQYYDSQTNMPHHTSTPNESVLSSSDGTNSALHTTAPTSLSSNGQYDDVQPPLKRKRTRQQVANEAKRRDVDGLGDPFFTYKPPPHPKKAPDVHVRVISDVRVHPLRPLKPLNTHEGADTFCRHSINIRRAVT